MNTRIRLSTIALPALILLASFLTACSGVLTSEQPAKKYYTLMPYGAGGHPGSIDSPALALTLTVVPGLDTDRILALGADASLHRYANARWPDNLPEVLTSVMRRSLLASGHFSAVEASGRKAEGRWGLKLEVQQFYGIRNSAGVTSSVLVDMAGELDCGGSNHQLAVSASTAVPEERLSAIVAAHQASLDEATRQLLARTSELCSTD